MSRDLLVLLQSHAFLKSARRTHGARMQKPEARALKEREDRAFLDILEFKSDDARVTLTQIRFLLSVLADVTPETDMAAELREACRNQSERLQRIVTLKTAGISADRLPSYPLLDALSDRVGIFDRNFRYKFTNAANLSFHGETLRDFVGRPSWVVTGERFFDKVNRPRFEACLAGQTVHCYSAHPNRDPQRIYSATYNPIYDADGEIRSLIMVSRDVTSIPIPKELITPLP